MWKVVRNIIVGWYNYLKGNINALTIHRRRICSKCPSNKKKWCLECGCFIPAKTLVKDEKCKLNKW